MPFVSAKTAIRLAAALVVGVCATTAFAVDYVVSRPTGYYESPPAGATEIFLSPGAGKAIAPPFPVQYFGRSYSSIGVSAYGYVQFGVIPTAAGSNNEAFPTTTPALDGVCAPIWEYMKTGQTGYAGPNDAFYWTSGTAPNRHFVISWENVAFNTIGSHGTFQLQLYETSGLIVFAYKTDPTSNWASFNYSSGIDSPGDTRYAAFASWNQWANFPGADQMFTPHVDVFSGRLLFDRVVSDASGIGNSVLANQPLAGARVEVRRDGAFLNAVTTAADGSFSLPAAAAPATATASLFVETTNAACTVKTAAGAQREWALASTYPFGADVNVGTLSVPSTGSLAAAFSVSRTILAVHDWAQARTAAVIPPITVSLDDTSMATTSYALNSTLFVAGPALQNSDMWDDSVLTKTYARHVLAAMTATLPTTPDTRFNAATDPQNAFAEGFSYYLYAAMTGNRHFVDGTGASTSTDVDLESPADPGPTGADVAGRVAMALYDLLDPANETTDAVDGTLTTDRVFTVADSVAASPTTTTFLAAWIAAGYDPVGITRLFVGAGLLADDDAEPNDSIGERSALGGVGVRRSGLVLNRFDDDWFSLALPSAVATLRADLSYNRGQFDTATTFELRDPAGALVATGSSSDALSPFRIATGPLAAGTYSLVVRYVSGVTLPAYQVQAYEPLAIAAAPLVDWTVGRDLDVPLGVVGGIPPYALTTSTGGMPPGLGLDANHLSAVGRPSTVGRYSVTVQAHDGANPSNAATTTTQIMTVHDVFKFPIAPFVGFPAGKSVDATLPTHEGTPPFTVSMSSGALTSGLSFAPNSLHVTGTATAGPSSAFELDGVDVAGSADHVATRAVVAVQLTGKKVPASLAAGVDACGWWFDAVEGSTVTFAVATAKGQRKRALTGAFLAPDRSLVTTGKIVGKLGGVAASKLVCPQSGRYYFVASSTDAGAATQLVGTATVALPKSGKGLEKTFKPSDTTTIEFGAVPGSTATVKFAGDKKATLVAKVVAVYDATGTLVTFADFVKPTPTGGTLTLPLPVGGTWKVVLGATSQNGTPGKLTYSYAVKQKKGGVYSAD